MNNPTSIVRTGVFATEEEAQEISRLAVTASNTPVIAFSSAMALSGQDASSMAWDLVHKACHRAALAHGLPEIQGYYGIDLEKREFVRT